MSMPGSQEPSPMPPMGGPIPGAEKKIIAGILGILLGWLGIHKFYLGYTQAGIIMLAASIIGAATYCLVIGMFIGTAVWIIGLVEGIIYLTKTDADFVATYVTGKKPWF